MRRGNILQNPLKLLMNELPEEDVYAFNINNLNHCIYMIVMMGCTHFLTNVLERKTTSLDRIQGTKMDA